MNDDNFLASVSARFVLVYYASGMLLAIFHNITLATKSFKFVCQNMLRHFVTSIHCQGNRIWVTDRYDSAILFQLNTNSFEYIQSYEIYEHFNSCSDAKGRQVAVAHLVDEETALLVDRSGLIQGLCYDSDAPSFRETVTSNVSECLLKLKPWNMQAKHKLGMKPVDAPRHAFVACSNTGSVYQWIELTSSEVQAALPDFALEKSYMCYYEKMKDVQTLNAIDKL